MFSEDPLILTEETFSLLKFWADNMGTLRCAMVFRGLQRLKGAISPNSYRVFCAQKVFFLCEITNIFEVKKFRKRLRNFRGSEISLAIFNLQKVQVRSVSKNKRLRRLEYVGLSNPLYSYVVYPRLFCPDIWTDITSVKCAQNQK